MKRWGWWWTRTTRRERPPEAMRQESRRPGRGSPGHGGNPGRQQVLLELRNLLERIKIHLMLAREVQAFNNKNSFVQAAQMVVELSRQDEGWLKTAP
jgi:hypothetical protein